jgi:hypothetical protein
MDFPFIIDIDLPDAELPTDPAGMLLNSTWRGVYELEDDTDWAVQASDKIVEVLNRHWPDNYHCFNRKLLMYTTGQASDLHNDEMFFEEGMVMQTCVLFLNEPESGGELCFPDHGIEVKPKKNRLVIFPTGIMYPHYVKEHTGLRYVFVPYITTGNP